MSTSFESRLEELEGAVAVLENLVARLLPDPPQTDDDFGSDSGAWVDRWLLPRLERQQSTGGGAGISWCPRWRDHPEASTRLEALRDAWEEARVGTAGAMTSWWIEKVDPTLRTIVAPDGPFARCREHHRRLPALPSSNGLDDPEVTN
jgi:hypothetical protein